VRAARAGVVARRRAVDAGACAQLLAGRTGRDAHGAVTGDTAAGGRHALGAGRGATAGHGAVADAAAAADVEAGGAGDAAHPAHTLRRAIGIGTAQRARRPAGRDIAVRRAPVPALVRAGHALEVTAGAVADGLCRAGGNRTGQTRRPARLHVSHRRAKTVAGVLLRRAGAAAAGRLVHAGPQTQLLAAGANAPAGHAVAGGGAIVRRLTRGA